MEKFDLATNKMGNLTVFVDSGRIDLPIQNGKTISML